MPLCEANSNAFGLVSEIAPEATRRRGWQAGKCDCPAKTTAGARTDQFDGPPPGESYPAASLMAERVACVGRGGGLNSCRSISKTRCGRESRQQLDSF